MSLEIIQGKIIKLQLNFKRIKQSYLVLKPHNEIKTVF